MAKSKKQANLKVNLTSMDIAEEKRTRLKVLFPDAFAEDKLDFDQLKRALGAWVEPVKERFGLNWPGRAECMKVIQQPSIATLKPVRNESVNFDTTENLFIEGDNLEVLKLLQKSYFGKVKMIYIDPPYNTGNEFIYPDKFSETLDTYLKYTGQKDGNGHKFSANTDTNGRYHSKWLNMMYPRLYLAKNLLRDDGVMFVSIGEDEITNLQPLCHQIFGEENVLGNFPVIMNLKGNQDAYGFSDTHEYIVVCTKSKEDCELNNFPVDDEEVLRNWKEDEFGLYKEADNLRATGINAPRSKRPNLWYPIFLNEDTEGFYITENDIPTSETHTAIYPLNPSNEQLSWYWSKDAFNKNKHNLILKHTSNGWQFYRKQRPQLGDLPTKKPKSVLYKSDYSTSTATTKLKELMEGKLFDNPKPVPFILDLSIIGTEKNDIILDFFAGSATTAHAVMQLNKEDGGNRKYIMVQLPEPCDETSEACKAGYKTIADIGKERIRRAAQKIAEEQGSLADVDGAPDFGFKVFKLDRSNFKVWEGDVEKIENLEQQLIDHVDHINAASTPEDILYELLLKSGFPLTTQVDTLRLAGKDVFSIEAGTLLICLDKALNEAVIDAIANENPREVICLDAGFKGDDQLKVNAAQTFKTLAQQEESEIVFRTV